VDQQAHHRERRTEEILIDCLKGLDRFRYDLAGNLTSTQQPGGNCGATPKVGCLTMAYDTAGQLAGVDYSDPATPDVTYGYDDAGRRDVMTDGTGTSTWDWDSLGRLTSSTDGAMRTLGYGYDLRGNVTSLTYPGTTGTVTRSYDDAGRLSEVQDWLGGGPTQFFYDANSFLTTQLYPNGTTATYTPDAGSRPAAIAHAPTASPGSPFASFAYGRDDTALVTSVTSTGVPADTHAYGYTPLRQLEQRDGGAQWAYDAADNLTRLSGSTSTTTWPTSSPLPPPRSPWSARPAPATPARPRRPPSPCPRG